jgi:thioredoxin 2
MQIKEFSIWKGYMNTLAVCPKCEKLNRVSLSPESKRIPICGNCKSELPLHDGVQDLNESTLTKLIRSSDRPVIVDFWAEWCGPCKAFAPTFKNAALKLGNQFIFAKVNTEAAPKAAAAYQIRGIPTLIIFKNGVEVDRQSGAMPMQMLMSHLEKWK